MLDKSSLTLDQSELSVLAHRPKTEQQIKNEELMRQLSGARTLIRELKQDNEWLKVTKEGLESECFTLKQLLNEKKQMLMEANGHLKSANDEINRLEDECREKDDLIETYLLEREKILEIAQNSRLEIQKLEKSEKQKDLLLENAHKEIQKLQKESEVEKIEYFSSIDDKLSLILENQKETDMKQEHKKSQQILQRRQNSSTSEIQRIFQKLEEVVARQKMTKAIYEEKILQKNRQIECISKQTSSLQNRIHQITKQLEKSHEAQTESQKALQVVTLNQNKENSLANQSYKELFNHHVQSISQLIILFTPLFKGEEELLHSVGELMKLKKPHREVQILLDEAKGVILQRNLQTHRGGETLKQLKEQQNKYNQIEEEMETLKLKHLSLQREYEAIMDDNRRIMKFHSLSRYRMERNLRGQKQNLPFSANRKEQNFVDHQ